MDEIILSGTISCDFVPDSCVVDTEWYLNVPMRGGGIPVWAQNNTKMCRRPLGGEHFVGETCPVELNVKHCLIYCCVKSIKYKIINRLKLLKIAYVKLLSSIFA